jgi:hypothetical protein
VICRSILPLPGHSFINLLGRLALGCEVDFNPVTLLNCAQPVDLGNQPFQVRIGCLSRQGAELIFADWFPLHSLFPLSCPGLEPSPHHAKAVGLFKKGPLPGFGLRGALGVDYVLTIGPADDPRTLRCSHRAA